MTLDQKLNGSISEKDFISEIKGCKTIQVKDFIKILIDQKEDEKGNITSFFQIEGILN